MFQASSKSLNFTSLTLLPSELKIESLMYLKKCD